ncbi:MAG: ASKHA domain-containing protein, partial [Rhodospirillaceae bacterium]
AGVAMEATCGARGRCRSCRVKIVKGEVPPPTIQDTVQLGHDQVRENFRLACQTKVIADSTVMPVPPKSEAGHQILAADASAALGRGLVLDSGVAKFAVKAKAPASEHNQTADWDEIYSVLPEGVSRTLSLDVMRKIPTTLRAKSGELTVTTFQDRVIDLEPGDTSESLYGMAFDVGTTSIVGSLIDLATGVCLANVGGVNPQAVYGGDLMSRIAYAQFDTKKLATLRARVLNALGDFVKEACTEAEVSPDHIYKMIIVGNTCMHHVLLGIDVSYVGLAPYAPTVNDAIVVPATELPLKAATNAQVCLLPIVAGFVGADTMGCVLATRIFESEEMRALVDIGTNGEVVMGHKGRLMACSAPAGPALEGAQIRHGMRGAMGAIEKVEITDDVSCVVIGGTPAIGICGSGLIDVCAKLVDAGVMDRSGRFLRKGRENLPPALQARFRDTPAGVEFILMHKQDAGKDEDITITQADVRQIQLAKSAIFSGIAMLQKVMGVADADLTELLMCGGFGNYINVENAVKIRLVPNLAVDKITYAGNAALMGAQIALLSETERERATELARSIEHVGLATHPDFQDLFVEGMSFLGGTQTAGDDAAGRRRGGGRKAALGGD